ncbi:MAG: hypothetical protein ACW98W_20500 [Candidatus Hodarchaeales archaeon]
MDRGRPVTLTSFSGVRTRALPFMSGSMPHLEMVPKISQMKLKKDTAMKILSLLKMKKLSLSG